MITIETPCFLPAGRVSHHIPALGWPACSPHHLPHRALPATYAHKHRHRCCYQPWPMETTATRALVTALPVAIIGTGTPTRGATCGPSRMACMGVRWLRQGTPRHYCDLPTKAHPGAVVQCIECRRRWSAVRDSVDQLRWYRRYWPWPRERPHPGDWIIPVDQPPSEPATPRREL